MKTLKLAPIVTLTATLLVPLPGAAFSLGEINVQSYLGSPFRATIPIQTEPAEEVDISCLNLAPPPPTEGMIYLRHAKLSLSRQGGIWQLHVSGSNVLNEPYISVLIQSGCQEQGRLMREYTVLIDPATFTEIPQSTEEKPADHESSRPPASSMESIAPPPRASSRATRTTEKRSAPAMARKKPARQSVQSAPSKDRLKVVSGVGEAPAKPGQTEKEQLQQREKELTKELDDKTAQFLAMQAQLVTLEAKLSEMQKTIALQNQMMASMQNQPAPPQKATFNWKDYWPAGPAILVAGMIYFLASRSRKRALTDWQPTLGANSGKTKNPF